MPQPPTFKKICRIILQSGFWQIGHKELKSEFYKDICAWSAAPLSIPKEERNDFISIDEQKDKKLVYLYNEILSHIKEENHNNSDDMHGPRGPYVKRNKHAV